MALHLHLRRALSTFSPAQDAGIVIAGGGIAGLAVSLALRRIGIGSVVLEQADMLRSGGVSITLSSNAWHVLDALGVGGELRPKFTRIKGLQLLAADGGKLLKDLSLEKDAPEQELRAVERKALVEALAGKLPPESISFSSRVRSVVRQGRDGTVLQLDDGRQLLAKIVIACDGVHSPLARWMGFPPARYAGHVAIRGISDYSAAGGHSFDPVVRYTYGRGKRAAFLPLSPEKAYWFMMVNSASPEWIAGAGAELKEETLRQLAGWPEDLLGVIRNTPASAFTKHSLLERWFVPGITPAASKNGVVLAGDAYHPMTPNIGQGACCALEDAAVLAAKLGPAVAAGTKDAVDAALAAYDGERRKRVAGVTVRAHLVGAVLQWDNPLWCSFRDKVLLSRLASVQGLARPADFKAELPAPATTAN